MPSNDLHNLWEELNEEEEIPNISNNKRQRPDIFTNSATNNIDNYEEVIVFDDDEDYFNQGNDELITFDDDDDYFEIDEEYNAIDDNVDPSLNTYRKEEDTSNNPNNLLHEIENYFTPMPENVEYSAIKSTYIDTGWIYNLNLDLVLSYAIEMGASDIHIQGNDPICFTIRKDIVKIYDFPIPDGYLMNEMTQHVLTSVQLANYNNKYDLDFSYTIKHGKYAGRRFRANIGRSFDVDFFVFRTINDEIPHPYELGITDQLIEWVKKPNGVWMVGGATGSGKSTTLASLLHYIQLNYPKKVITIEKPIEYVYPSNQGKALIIQREVGEGQDTLEFSNGLTAAMRENPDIILIGEVRNNEEVSELIRAAETGHLAITTIHTNSVPTTLNRIFSLFPPEDQNRIRSTLADTLKGLMNQTLVRTKDSKGMFAVREILEIDDNIRRMIINNDVAGIRDFMIKEELTMEHQLLDAYINDRCTFKEIKSLAPDILLLEKIITDKNKKIPEEER